MNFCGSLYSPQRQSFGIPSLMIFSLRSLLMSAASAICRGDGAKPVAPRVAGTSVRASTPFRNAKSGPEGACYPARWRRRARVRPRYNGPPARRFGRDQYLQSPDKGGFLAEPVIKGIPGYGLCAADIEDWKAGYVRNCRPMRRVRLGAILLSRLTDPVNLHGKVMTGFSAVCGSWRNAHHPASTWTQSIQPLLPGAEHGRGLKRRDFFAAGFSGCLAYVDALPYGTQRYALKRGRAISSALVHREV